MKLDLNARITNLNDEPMMTPRGVPLTIGYVCRETLGGLGNNEAPGGETMLTRIKVGLRMVGVSEVELTEDETKIVLEAVKKAWVPVVWARLGQALGTWEKE